MSAWGELEFISEKQPHVKSLIIVRDKLQMSPQVSLHVLPKCKASVVMYLIPFLILLLFVQFS